MNRKDRNNATSKFLILWAVGLSLFSILVNQWISSRFLIEDQQAQNLEINRIHDLCGVRDGKETSCNKELQFSGIDIKTEKNWRIRELLSQYVDLHNRIMDPNDHSVSKKYIVFDDDPETGLGNRFQAIVATFLFAILSERALLIDWPHVDPMMHWNGEESVAMPAISELLENPSFNWDYSQFKNRPEFKCTYQENYKVGDDTSFLCCNPKEEFTNKRDLEIISELSKMKNLTNANATLLSQYFDCKHHKRYRGIEEEFQCGYFDKDFPEETIRILTWDYFVPNLMMNPFYSSKIKRTFELLDVFTPLSRFLFRPIKSIRDKMDKFKKENFGDYNLGLQIRKVGINKLNDTQEDLFWECAINMTEMNSNQFSKKKEDIKIKWFLATDNPITRSRAIRDFGDRIVYWDAPIGRNTTEGVISGLIDMWLISESDDIIVSAASTYGKISYGLRGKPPRYVNRLTQCIEKIDWQPCFFQLKKYFCWVDFNQTYQPKEMEMEMEIEMRDKSQYQLELEKRFYLQISDCKTT